MITMHCWFFGVRPERGTWADQFVGKRRRVEMVRCNAPWEGFHVLYGGDVKCCTWSNVVLGNSHTQSIAEIWNGPQFAEIRQRMYDDDLATICPSWCPRLYKDSSKPRLEPGRAETFNGNVARIQAEIALGETQLGSLPIDFRIVPTNACNLRCVMCGQDRGTRRSFGVDFQQDLASFYPYARSILAIGGEPLLARAFVALVRDFDFDLYPDMKFRIVTNGTQFKDSILSLLPGRFDFVGISIHSAINEKLERIRPGIRLSLIHISEPTRRTP